MKQISYRKSTFEDADFPSLYWGNISPAITKWFRSVDPNIWNNDEANYCLVSGSSAFEMQSRLRGGSTNLSHPPKSAWSNSRMQIPALRMPTSLFAEGFEIGELIGQIECRWTTMGKLLAHRGKANISAPNSPCESRCANIHLFSGHLQGLTSQNLHAVCR